MARAFDLKSGTAPVIVAPPYVHQYEYALQPYLLRRRQQVCRMPFSRRALHAAAAQFREKSPILVVHAQHGDTDHGGKKFLHPDYNQG